MNSSYDMPSNYYYGGGGDTYFTPLALALIIFASLLIFFVRRRYVIAPLLAGAFFIPMHVNLVVLGLHLQSYRLTLLAGCLRMGWGFMAGDRHPRRLSLLDKVFLGWALCDAVTFCLLWGQWAAVVNKIGFLYTTLAAYFLVRYLIRDKADVLRTIKVLACILAVIAPLMVIEHINGHNLFSTLGAIEISAVREGSIRATGPFAHPIIAGTIAAMLMPLFVGLWWQGKRHRWIAAMGVLASTAIMVASASSTPMMTYAAGILALCLWRARANLRIFRWALVIILVGLNMVMKAPVWFLMARAGGVMGGSGWHRAMLIDTFIRRFSEWWLIGTQNNSQWGYDMWDSINAYVNAGVEGGLITFALFIAVFVYAYKRVGKSRLLAQKNGTRRDALLVWAIGASLLANSVAFFGIAYFDQSVIAWYALLAMVSATATFTEAQRRPPLQFESAKKARSEAELHAEDYQTFASLMR